MENPFLKEYSSLEADYDLVEKAKKENKKALEQLVLKHHVETGEIVNAKNGKYDDIKDKYPEATVVIG